MRRILREARLLLTFQVDCARFIVYEVVRAVEVALKRRNHVV